MIFRSSLFILVTLSFMACQSSKLLTNNQEDEILYETVILDTVSVEDTAEIVENDLPIYHPSAKRTMDLIHTKLEVRFDWEKQYLLGRAYLTLKPYFYSTNKIVLDAKGFEINTIQNWNTKTALSYIYDGLKLTIDLDKSYQKEETILLFIDYIAKPNEGPQGGFAAITSDKGLFFINPLNKEEGKPQQIWTQGETESGSRWFPTIDKPNERCTQEIFMTVQDKYKTLSNGLMISSNKNHDGTRTDYWKMDQPHAPYLFMMAVGDFAKVDDQWNGIPLSYYVEPAYESSAKDIFAHTPEMLNFFSDKIGVKYPWPKYAQIVVRDYVSGAMENTTASVFGESVQKTSKELLDYNNDMIVAHEMFHHWFGDLVTCESWSNLTLNEGFANYSEYLWAEEKYGRKTADAHKAEEKYIYLLSLRNGGHDLIHYEYGKKEQMFDAHSYNKGGMVLHMLRDYVGDEAFFASLNKYLTDNAYSAVEADELRMAFEDVVGEDLNWFFNQWFFSSGHPILNIEKTYDFEPGAFKLDIEQTQSPSTSIGIFTLPITVSFIYEDGTVIEKEIILNKRKQSFVFDQIQPNLKSVIIDKNDILLIEKNEAITDEEAYFSFLYNDTYISKMEGLNIVENADNLNKIIIEGLKDENELIRIEALYTIHKILNFDLNVIEKLIISDPSSSVRAVALDVLNESNPTRAIRMAESILESEPSYIVINEALNIIGDNNPTLALIKAEQLSNDQAQSIKIKIAEIFAQYGNEKHITFFEKNIITASQFSVFPIYNNYQKLITKVDYATVEKVCYNLSKIGKNMDVSPIKRYLATKTISDSKKHLIKQKTEDGHQSIQIIIEKLAAMITAIKAKETNDKIKAMYGSME